MKIQIDTKNKIIKIEETVSLSELMEFIKDALPNWKEYKLDTNVIYSWQHPVAYPPFEPTVIYYDSSGCTRPN